MAGRIPQSFIDELLTRVDIVSVIERFLTLRKVGANYVALCPFHQEKTPSFSISQTKQFYHCFGCGVSGNAISFLMDYEHLEFGEAVETLASQVGMQVPQEASAEISAPSNQPLYDLMEKASQFYQKALRQHTPAINYLKQRGLSGEMAKQFHIGYAPAGWDNLLSAIAKSDSAKKILLKTGMLIKKNADNFYDRFRDRIMFPIRDRRGRVIAFGGRVIDSKENPKYLNSPETPIFHKGSELYGLYEARKATKKLDRMMIVEGYTDVVALAQHGITYTVATLGTATSSQHIQQLFRLTREVIFCFDGDNAGLVAARRALEIALSSLHDDWLIKFMFLPKEEDPDSLIRKEGKQNFETRMQKAQTLSEFFFSHLTQQIDMQTMDGRAHLVSLAMPMIQKIPANIMREMFLETLSKLARIQVEKLQTTASKKVLPKITATEKRKTKLSPIRLALILLIQHPQLMEYWKEGLPKIDSPGMDLLRSLCLLLKDRPNLSTGAILEHFRNRPEIKQLSALASYEHMVPIEGLAVEFCAALNRLNLQAIENQIEALVTKAGAHALTRPEKEQLQTLLKQKQEVH